MMKVWGISYGMLYNINWVVVSNILYFHPEPWGMIQFDEHIFQMGWFNHQLVPGYLPITPS